MRCFDATVFLQRKIKGRDKNGELDREAELDEQYPTAKLLCGGLRRVYG